MKIIIILLFKMEEELKEELLYQIERVIKSNDNLVIYCENQAESFELTFQGNNLFIEFSDQEIYNPQDGEGYPVNNYEYYNSLEEVQEGAIDFIKEYNAIYDIEIKRNNKVLFSKENFEKSIKHKIKNLPKREIGMRFGVSTIFDVLDKRINNDPRLIKLLDEGHVNDRNGEWAPIIAAVMWSDVNLVKLLLKYKPELNIFFGSNTLIHLAVERNDLEIIKLLLKAGAYPNIKNNKGKTPIDIATEGLNSDMYLPIGKRRLHEIITILQEYTTKIDKSVNLIQGRYRTHLTKRKTDAANVIKSRYLHYSYKPDGPGYNRIKARYSSFGKKQKTIKLPNNTNLGPTLKGYNTGIFGSIVVVSINREIHKSRLSRDAQQGYFRANIKGKIYRFKSSGPGRFVTLKEVRSSSFGKKKGTLKTLRSDIKRLLKC